MAIGPVQLIVLGFEHPRFHGEIIAELERLRESDTVRVIDALAVYKDAEGELEVEDPQQPDARRGARARYQGRRADRSRDRGRGGHGGRRPAGAPAAADGIHPDPRSSTPLGRPAAQRDRARRGLRISDGFISPLDLVGIRLVSAEEAKQLHAQDTAAAAATS